MRTQIALRSDPIERTPACSQTEITGSGQKFERTTVWTMVWSRSGRRSIWSEKSRRRRIRAHLSLIKNGSSVNGSDQKCYQTQLGMIREQFERFIFFHFLFLYWEMLALPRGSKTAAFWSETHLKTDKSDQKRSAADSKGRSPSEEILINWRPRCFLWKAVWTNPFSQNYTLNGTLNKVYSQQLGFVFFSKTFIFHVFLDELKTANISFYEMSIS